MQAIRTTYGRPPGPAGGRLKATAAAGSVTVAYDHALRNDIEANHRHAAEVLIAKLGWNVDGYGSLVSGCLPDGSWAHVLTGRDGKGG